MSIQPRSHPKFLELCNSAPKHPIAMITAYDALTAQVATKAGADILLVGDSVATVCLGYKQTSELPFEEFKFHAASVLRFAGETPVIADITYDVTQSNSELLAAAQWLKEQGCSAVKIEFAAKAIQQTVHLRSNDISVVGHIGITPQSILAGQAIKAVGQNATEIDELKRVAKEFEDAGCCMLVLECVTIEAVQQIKATVNIPVIGIGSGGECDGQVLVFHDIIGWNNGFTAKFTKTFHQCQPFIEEGVREYVRAVHNSTFPEDRHAYHQAKH